MLVGGAWRGGGFGLEFAPGICRAWFRGLLFSLLYVFLHVLSFLQKKITKAFKNEH